MNRPRPSLILRIGTNVVAVLAKVVFKIPRARKLLNEIWKNNQNRKGTSWAFQQTAMVGKRKETAPFNLVHPASLFIVNV